MTTTIQAARRRAALGVFAAVLLAIGTPRNAVAHAELTADEAAGRRAVHPPEAPTNLQVEGATYTENGVPYTDNTMPTVSWSAGHSHSHQDVYPRENGYQITVSTSPLPTFDANNQCIGNPNIARRLPPGCRQSTMYNPSGSSYSRRLSLTPETTNYVHVATIYRLYGFRLVGESRRPPGPPPLRWEGDDVDGPLHATINGTVAGTLILTSTGIRPWTASEDTLRRYPYMSRTGGDLSTMRARLENVIRGHLVLTHGSTATITATRFPSPPDPETPDPETPTTPDPETPDPETPDPEIPTTPTTPDPETPTTPDPEAPDCTYKHRLIGVPGSTANAYTARILVSSEEPNATATVRAYQRDNGAPIDVLDEGGSAVGSTTSLAPAHSVKRFRLEDVRGWHTVVIEHPTARAMRRATVAMMLRGPDVGVQIEHVQGIEDCTPAATTAE